MQVPAEEVAFGIVEITRDFLCAHRMLRRVAERHRALQLSFTEIQELVSDGEESVLFRLKECSHALFRGRSGVANPSRIGPEALFDLAVGSLFHEAMKFRENFYQRDAYGPKVRALREAQVPDAEGLLQEFERILSGADERLEESLREAETLLAETMGPFRALLRAHAHNGFLSRYLIRQAVLVEEAFGEPIDAVLTAIHGSAGAGWAHAARSYLESGFFAEAVPALEVALSRGAPRAAMSRLRRYALGMRAYLEGHYLESLDHLSAWIDAGPPAEAALLTDFALSVLARVGQLVEQDEAGEIQSRAAELERRLRRFTAEKVPVPSAARR